MIQPSISVIIPALNEEKLLSLTVKLVVDACLSTKLNYEIIIVDDGSTDNTLEIAFALSNQYKNIKVIRHDVNLGIGAAYKNGLSASSKEHIILIPADNAWPYESLTDIFLLIGSVDIIIPYITTAGDKNLFRKIISRIYTQIINTVFRLKVPYYNGIVVHRLDLVKSIHICANGFFYQTELLVKILKLHPLLACKFVPSATNIRTDGKSKALSLKNLIGVIVSLITLSIYILKK